MATSEEPPAGCTICFETAVIYGMLCRNGHVTCQLCTDNWKKARPAESIICPTCRDDKPMVRTTTPLAPVPVSPFLFKRFRK